VLIDAWQKSAESEAGRWGESWMQQEKKSSKYACFVKHKHVQNVHGRVEVSPAMSSATPNGRDMGAPSSPKRSAYLKKGRTNTRSEGFGGNGRKYMDTYSQMLLAQLSVLMTSL
jgi:hypothetical protein